MSYDITFKNLAPAYFESWLATIPVLTHSEIKSDSFVIPNRDGVLYGDEYRGDASWTMMFHLRKSEVSKKKRKLRQWLSGEGRLVINDTPDSFYEVKRVILTEDYNRAVDYGRINTQFIVYPYEFLTSGETGIVGGGTIANEHDPSMPLYKIEGNGSGTLTVNGHNMTFTVTTQDNGIFIDTRREIAYNNSGDNKNGVLSGYYRDIRFKTGNNVVSITSGFTLTIYPRWGYVI